MVSMPALTASSLHWGSEEFIWCVQLCSCVYFCELEPFVFRSSDIGSGDLIGIGYTESLDAMLNMPTTVSLSGISFGADFFRTITLSWPVVLSALGTSSRIILGALHP